MSYGESSRQAEPESTETAEIVFSNLCIVLYNHMKLREVAALIRRATRLHPDYTDHYWALGDALLVQQKLDEAEQAYRDYIKLEPNKAMGYNRLSVVLAQQHRLSEAEEAQMKAKSLADDSEEIGGDSVDLLRVCLLIRFLDCFSASFEPEALAVRFPFGP